MLLIPAVMLTAVGGVFWILGEQFGNPGLSAIGAVLVVGVGAMILSGGLEVQAGKVKNTAGNTVEIERTYQPVKLLPSMPLGVVWMLGGALLMYQGVDPDA